MPPIGVVIKPVSSSCNLACEYCYYANAFAHQAGKNMETMSLSTLETVIEQVFETAQSTCTIAWQGGEPTLAGLEFFEKYIVLEKKYNLKQLPVHRVIQTNGVVVNERWVRFFAEHDFLVGVSMDGDAETHDRFRGPSFSAAQKALRLLREHEVKFNVLTVVNSFTVSRIQQIYQFFKSEGYRHQQYILCVDPIDQKPGQTSWNISPEEYQVFLIDLFNLWFADWQQGVAPYIRRFDNYIGLLRGELPESCEQLGVCSSQTVIEADGTVYPCDFFISEAELLGNVNTNSLLELTKSARAKAFFDRSVPLPTDCEGCRFVNLCRGGCYRYRLHSTTSPLKDYYCESYKGFFEAVMPKLLHVARYPQG